jgi:hypothetical protein
VAKVFDLLTRAWVSSGLAHTNRAVGAMI